MKSPLRIGYSPCPNDTFIFHGLASGAVDWPGGLDVTLADVERLNGLAADGALDVVKVSVAAAAEILDDYVLLRAGGAMGYGVGPLLVAREERPLESLDGASVAIPGRRTTANLLFGLCCHEAGVAAMREEMIFDEIMDGVLSGGVDAGVIIHEGRFTFRERGLVSLMDLGSWWEDRTGLPIPLGGIAIRRSLGEETAQAMNAAIRASLTLARENPASPWEYVQQHAQEMDDAVIRRHIETFVTDYSLDVGEAGERGVERLLAEAGWSGGKAFITR